MKMIARVLGIKRSKGVMNDTGKAYDSTTLYIEFPFPSDSQDARGAVTQPMKYGTSDNYEKFNNQKLPFMAELEIENVTNGRSISQQLVSVVPMPKEQQKV